MFIRVTLLATRVCVNVTLLLPSVRQLWHYCTALSVWIYVSLTCSYTRSTGQISLLTLRWVITGRALSLAITGGIRPPNLQNLQVLDETESLLPNSD